MKVTRKVGRRKHSRHSSISRRRLRNSKNKKSGYKKRYGKTHKGGYWSGAKAKKGGARSRKYGHKPGKRFHRGGVNSDDSDDSDDISASYDVPIDETPPPIASTPALSIQALPDDLKNFANKTIMPNALNFEYKRTDKMYGINPKPETGLFDVVTTERGNQLQGIYLLRRDKNNNSKYDKRLYIPTGIWTTYNSTKPFTGIEGYLPDSSSRAGTYTFPPSDTNQQSFQAVKQFI